MRVLLDTHVWLCIVAAPERLSAVGRRLVSDLGTELLLSSVSALEIAIKWRLNKLPLPDNPEVLVPEWMNRTGVTPLPVLHRHALRVAALPGHHRDPFDRLLVAQAQIEELPILTADRVFERYEVEVKRA
ncbi:MAG: type II toxin-antitoxin system VapC family toxin [Gemmatimonadales bacterium]